jgi:hypothetical protein
VAAGCTRKVELRNHDYQGLIGDRRTASLVPCEL